MAEASDPSSLDADQDAVSAVAPSEGVVRKLVVAG